jgi:HEAT repeat protein
LPLGPSSSQQDAQTPQAQAIPAFAPKEIIAWSLLTESAGEGRSAHDRVQAMAALGTMGRDEKAAHLIEEGIKAHDPDVQVAAILAAGLTRNPALLPRLEAALDDDKPEVAFAAASTLWKMHDYAGEDLLTAIAEGDRKAKPGLIRASKHKAAQELHSPKALTLIALEQGSGFFLGPFGVGIKAIEYVDKNSGAGARASAVDLIAQEHTDHTRDVLIDLLTDGEPAVRAAAAKGLGRWPGDATMNALVPLFGDNKLAVRLTAAASYLRAKNNIATPQDCECGER